MNELFQNRNVSKSAKSTWQKGWFLEKFSQCPWKLPKTPEFWQLCYWNVLKSFNRYWFALKQAKDEEKYQKMENLTIGQYRILLFVFCYFNASKNFLPPMPNSRQLRQLCIRSCWLKWILEMQYCKSVG